MSDFLKQILTSQYEAALAMMKQRIEVCPPEYWDDHVSADTFRQVAYHALFFLEYYLSTEAGYSPHELHTKGGEELGDKASPGLSKEDTLALVEICRTKIGESLAPESDESLEGPSGFSFRKGSRGELHIYNIRHFQHHVGQLSGYLRRISIEHDLSLKLPWVGNGWK
ncbi:MAG: DinB family protein [Bacteroidota bacterium]|nr:DinB family protein [Bacteroidota bacterium]MDP4231576.1 DinB family protein [Bacteroidota bacterium]MDP4236824.1 DinB family protein [Bacteroidota bacterium]